MKNNIISRVINSFRAQNTILDPSSLFGAGWHSVGATLDHLQNDRYENGYSSIRAIANRFMTLQPYAIDDNGKPYETNPNVINCLARPNLDMSGVDFRDALAVMTLVHDNVYILVHERYGRGTRPASEGVTEERIAGFTFLENVLEVVVDGKTQYEVYTKGEKQVYYPYQVMHLHDVNPNNISGGYSPSRAARRWTKIDDYIADYQRGFFENGAIPAGQLLITAPSTQEFDDIVANLKKKHRGAGANNNVVYTYQPIDPNTGKAGQAGITWIPYNTSNKDLALKEIFEQVNSKIDSVYGVSAFIRAIDEAPNFATAQVIERNFVDNTVRPFTLKKWGRIQHELNRITGGLGYGIAFRLPTPHIAEEEKSIADTNKVIWETLQGMIQQGFTYDSACDALKLPANWKLLEAGDSTETTIDNDKADITDEDLDDVPQNRIPAKYKAEYDVDILESELLPFENQISEILNDNIRKQVDNALGTASNSEESDMTEEMIPILIAIMQLRGDQVYSDGVMQAAMAGIPVEAGKYLPEISDEESEQLEEFVKGFNDQTARDIDEIKAGDPSLVTALLAGYLVSQVWRVQRFSRNESWTYAQLSGNQATLQLEERISGYFTKTWVIQPGACPICIPLDGETVRESEQFSNGLNLPPAHISCRCDVERNVVKEVNNAVERELHCSKCDRFLGETTQAKYTDKIKCSNSKCKALEIPTVKEKS